MRVRRHDTNTKTPDPATIDPLLTVQPRSVPSAHSTLDSLLCMSYMSLLNHGLVNNSLASGRA